jgi:energy-coupling factor transporter transmembrane protein EcfT
LEITVLILILLAAVAIFFATRLLGKTLKLITQIALIITVILVFLTILIYRDVNEMKDGFMEKNNTFLLYENNHLYSAITLKPLENATLSLDSFTYSTKEELERFEDELNKKNYDALLANNFKVFIIKPIVLNKPYNISLLVDLNEGDLLGMLLSDQPFNDLAKKTNEKINMSVEDLESAFEGMYESEEQIKGYIFAALLANYFQSQKPGELISNIKSGRIVIYPESISFKVIKYLPLPVKGNSTEK